MRQGAERSEHPCIADENIELAEFVGQRRAEHVDFVKIAQILRDQCRLRAHRFYFIIKRFERAGGAGKQDNMRAGFGIGKRHFLADTTRGAGDQGQFAGEVNIAHNYLFCRSCRLVTFAPAVRFSWSVSATI